MFIGIYFNGNKFQLVSNIALDGEELYNILNVIKNKTESKIKRKEYSKKREFK